MRIAVCYKCVPYSSDIEVNPDRSLNTSKAEWEIGQYDQKAVEAGVRLASEGDTVIALTANGEIVSNSKMRKAILSRGPAEMFGIQDPFMSDADSYATASVLKAGIDKIGDVDLVLCGEGSGDVYSQQVGNILGGLLGWTTVNGVSCIEKEGQGLRLTRELEAGGEVVDVKLPAVISVTGDINAPRIPSMKDILGAGKKPATVWSLSDVCCTPENAGEVISTLAPEQLDRKKIVLDGASDEGLDAFVSYLKKLF